MANVTEKSTKQEIFDAYQNAVRQLKAREESQLNPEKAKASKRKAEVVERVKGLSTDGVTKSIETVRSRAATVLGQLEQEITSQLTELDTVKEALAAHQAELKEIYGIEAEATGLAALVEAQRERRTQFEKELTERRVAFDTEMAAARKNWEIEKAEYLRTQTLRNEQDRVARDRDLETSKYNFERDQKAKYDQLTDALNVRTKAFEAEMEARNKAFAAQQEALAKREATQKELEDAVASLEAQISTLNATMENKVAAATDAGKKAAATSYAIETNALKKSHEAEVTVLQGRVATLEAQLKEYRESNVTLNNKLEAAYAKVQSVAERALEAQGNARALAEVQRTVESQTNSKR